MQVDLIYSKYDVKTSEKKLIVFNNFCEGII